MSDIEPDTEDADVDVDVKISPSKKKRRTKEYLQHMNQRRGLKLPNEKAEKLGVMIESRDPLKIVCLFCVHFGREPKEGACRKPSSIIKTWTGRCRSDHIVQHHTLEHTQKYRQFLKIANKPKGPEYFFKGKEAPQEGRGFNFPKEKALKLGVMIESEDPLRVTCLFCLRFGREAKEGSTRKPSKIIKKWTGRCRTDHIVQHHTIEHRQRYEEFLRTCKNVRRAASFFAGADLPSFEADEDEEQEDDEVEEEDEEEEVAAPRARAPAPAPVPPAVSMTPEERFEQVKRLLDNNYITLEEYEMKRQQIIALL